MGAVQCIPLVEPVCVPEIFIDGIARIERIGPNLKLTFYSLQHPSSGEQGDMERVVVARFVMPAEAVHSAAMAAMAAVDTDVALATH